LLITVSSRQRCRIGGSLQVALERVSTGSVDRQRRHAHDDGDHDPDEDDGLAALGAAAQLSR
jgi:hypothetical protein